MIPEEIRENQDITFLNGFHLPVKARYLFEYTNETSLGQLQEIITWAEQQFLPVILLGSGTNVVFATDLFEGVVIVFKKTGTIWQKNDVLEIMSGTKVSSLVQELLAKDVHQFGGIYAWCGLP